jgi:hypothetical protein
MAEIEVPVCSTLEEGLKYGVTSTGRQLGVVPTETHGMWRIRYIDGRTGSMPEKLQGKYTGVKHALHDLNDFITKTWLLAAENAPKSAKKKNAPAEAEAA